MLGRLARAAYVLFVTAMIVAWAISVGSSSPVEPKNDPPVVELWYC